MKLESSLHSIPPKKVGLNIRIPEEKIMIEVLLSNLEDYLRAVNLGGKDFEKELKIFRQKDDAVKGRGHKAAHKGTSEYRRFKILVHGERAKNYLFSNSESSDTSPFGFKFICWHFGLDADKGRKNLKLASKGILKKFLGVYFKERKKT
jgi:hypothetical protein